jgi:hypothetical protein
MQSLLHFLTLEDKLFATCATCFNIKKRLVMPPEGSRVSNDSQNKQ